MAENPSTELPPGERTTNKDNVVLCPKLISILFVQRPKQEAKCCCFNKNRTAGFRAHTPAPALLMYTHVCAFCGLKTILDFQEGNHRGAGVMLLVRATSHQQHELRRNVLFPDGRPALSRHALSSPRRPRGLCAKCATKTTKAVIFVSWKRVSLEEPTKHPN